MNKIYFFLVLALVSVNLVNAQAVVPEVFNFLDLARWDADHPQLRSYHEFNEWDELLPKSLSLPPGATIRLQATSNTPLVSKPAAVSPSPTQSWLGYIDPNQYIPPDTHGCVGLNHVITYTNDYIIIHNKAGGAIISQMNTFTWAGTPNAAGDPYIKYDPVANRWIAIGFTAPSTGANKIYVNVSQTSDPTGNWNRYAIQPQTAATGVFWDHPFMGFDNRFIVVNGNEFTNSFLGSGLVFMDKATLYSGGILTMGVNAQTLEDLGADAGSSPCPVTVYGINPSTDFNIIQSWNGTSIRLTKVSGNIPNLVWNIPAAIFPSAPAGQNWQEASDQVAQQAGEARKIETNPEISCAVMINQNIWCVHAIGLPAIGAINNVATQWWQVTTDGAIIQRGRIGVIPGEYRFYPSIAVNKNESALIGYTFSSVNTKVSAAYSTRCLTTPQNTTDDEFIYKTGLASYWKDFGGGRCRWGDYSHTCVDPVDGSLWTVQEYAAARVGSGDNASRYGIWWAQVTPANCTIQRDATISSVTEPRSDPPYCINPINPQVTIRNFGSDTLHNVTVVEFVDNILIGSQTLTNLNLATLGSITINLAPISSNTSILSHTFKVYTSLPNGLADQNPNNDTATVVFKVSKIVIPPLVEGFENPLFPPDGWNVSNPDGLITWERTTLVGSNSNASMVIRNFDYPIANTVDKFYSPVITNNAIVDSFFVSFDYAYSPKFRNPGATGIPLDTLELQITQDCGKTFTNVWKKWGQDLSTISDTLTANNPNNTAFVPQKQYDWKNAKTYLTPSVGTQNFQVYFVAKSNKQNNLYIDNINIFGKTVPAKVKSQGYLIYPSPFTSFFKIHHYRAPVNLQSVSVYNSIGQLVWRKDLNGQGNTEEFVDMQNMAPGVYEVKLTFSNKTIVERVVKLQ